MSLHLSLPAARRALCSAYAEGPQTPDADPEPVHLSLGAGHLATTGSAARLAEHPSLWSPAMRPRLAGARLLGLVIAVGAITFAILVFIPFAMPWNRTLHLQLEAGAYGELNPGAWVELSGAKVGSVDSVSSKDGHALIQVSIDAPHASQLHGDTTAAIRPH